MNIKVTGGYDKSNCTTTETSEPINFNKEYTSMSKTKSEYDIGCYYEFSDDSDFDYYQTMVLSSVNKGKFNKYPYVCSAGNAYEYIRPLTTKAGEIRKPKLLIGFVNVYSAHDTKEQANRYSGNKRIACIDLSQFNEGEGL